MGWFSKIKSSASKALDIISAPLSQPVTTFTKGIGAGALAVKKSRARIRSGDKLEAVKNVAKTIGTTAAIGGAVLAAAPSAATGSAGVVSRNIVKSAAKKSSSFLFGSPARAATTTIGAGALAASPTLRKTTVELPKTLFKTGSSLGKTIEKSKDKKDLSNIASKAITLGAGAALIGGGALVAKKVVDKIQQPKIEKTPKISQPKTFSAQPVQAATYTIPKETPGQVKEKPPKTSEKPMSVNQTVNVKVSQKQSKKYINAVAIAR